jgi:Na+/glutamate symporter
MLPRLSGAGATAGLVALLIWPFHAAYLETLLWPLLASALVAGVCGLCVLLATVWDMLFHRRRGQRIRPVRAFDIVLAVALIALSLAQLYDLAGQLPAWVITRR